MDINAEWAPNQADPEPTYEDFRAGAAARGHTRAVICNSDRETFEGWVKPDAHLDDVFKLTCSDTGVVFKLRGWEFDVEDDQP